MLQPEAPSEIRSISAKVPFPWLVGRFPPARHSGAAKICFIPGQIVLYFTLWVVNQVMYSSMGGASRTMVKDILAAIDAEIACLEQAKTLLSASGAFVAKRKPGRPTKVATAVAPKV